MTGSSRLYHHAPLISSSLFCSLIQKIWVNLPQCACFTVGEKNPSLRKYPGKKRSSELQTFILKGEKTPSSLVTKSSSSDPAEKIWKFIIGEAGPCEQVLRNIHCMPYEFSLRYKLSFTFFSGGSSRKGGTECLRLKKLAAWPSLNKLDTDTAKWQRLLVSSGTVRFGCSKQQFGLQIWL